ncbi:transposase, partial [Streptomyces sp. HSW2009]
GRRGGPVRTDGPGRLTRTGRGRSATHGQRHGTAGGHRRTRPAARPGTRLRTAVAATGPPGRAGPPPAPPGGGAPGGPP